MALISVPREAQISEYLHTKAAAAGIPMNGTFELTPCCNMACRMCYVRMTETERQKKGPLKTAREWIALAREAKKDGLLFLLLTGGEPFLRADFRELLAGLHAEGFVITINSNGTLIDEETVAWLKETPPVRINITLYGASNETYSRLCGNPRGFTEVTRAIRLLREAGITVKLNCSVTPYNVDDLEAIFAFAKRENLVVQATSYMFPPLRRNADMVGQNDRFSPAEAAAASARIASLMNGEDAYLTLLEREQFPALPGDTGEDCPDDGEEGGRLWCRAGRCSFWVTWDGRMLPCGMFSPEAAPDVFRDGFRDAWEKTKAFADSIRLPARCSSCAVRERCKTCAAMVYTENGGFTETPPAYRCDMMRAYPGACEALGEQIRRRTKTESPT